MNILLKFFAILILSLSLGSSYSVHAWEWKDPTEGKPFFDWAWNEELKPTIKQSIDKTGLVILASGSASTLITAQYDDKLYSYNKKNPVLFSEKDADRIGDLGNGFLGVGIALTQIVLDQENGIKHFKALLLTSLSHVTISSIYRRDRPDGSKTLTASFPSGHAAAAFAGAASLSYSYGWVAGVPAYVVASAFSISRLSENKHWASDLVAGAFIGSFWARASFYTEDKKETAMWVPTPVDDGLMVSWIKEF